MQALLALLPSMARQTARFLRFAFLPNFERSLKPVGHSYYNFGRILTVVFGTIGLVEKTHPWRRPEAKPRPLEVLGYACAKADWKRPLAMPTVLTAAITLLLSTGLISAMGMGVNLSVSAGQAYAGSLFTPSSPSTDLALKYMSNSFGINIPGVPMGAVDGFVSGFQRMMALYSTAMLIIAGFILLYILLGVIASTAHEGRFGGSGFNQVWAPIRLVVAIGLLVPISNSYNSGQYIVMKLAEWGSGMATNLWVPFATSLASRGDVVATPNVPAAAEAVRGLLFNEFCRARYNRIKLEMGLDNTQVPPVVTKTATHNGNTTIFYTSGADTQNNYCGLVSYSKSIAPGIMATTISNGYETAYNNMRASVQVVAERLNDYDMIHPFMATAAGNEGNVKPYLVNQLTTIITSYQNELATVIASTAGAQSTTATNAMTTAVNQSGWAGAGMWFNTIARLNSEIMSAARGLPATQLPTTSNATNAAQGPDASNIANKVDEGLGVLKQYTDNLPALFADVGVATNTGAGNVSGVFTPAVMTGLDSNAASSTIGKGVDIASGAVGFFIDKVFAKVFGGPFDQIGLGADTGISNINPLAQLAAVGNWLLYFAMTCVGVAAIPIVPTAVMFVLIGMAAMTFSAGVLLFYVTPLMPFIRLVFGICSWLLNILEAVVAIPLLAIAHLSTGGGGISGDMARTGYMMIFSIFLRPALMIVGMVAALMMFIVAIGILNDAYKAAVTGFMGADAAKGGLSIIMYTIMYVAIAYGLCNMTFKLVEEIPNRAMTWINQAAAREVTQDEGVSRALTGTGSEFIAMSRSVVQQAPRLGASKAGPSLR
jgi:conjugal transfer/type IV secretion protein DotA/TraY